MEVEAKDSEQVLSFVGLVAWDSKIQIPLWGKLFCPAHIRFHPFYLSLSRHVS